MHICIFSASIWIVLTAMSSYNWFRGSWCTVLIVRLLSFVSFFNIYSMCSWSGAIIITFSSSKGNLKERVQRMIFNLILIPYTSFQRLFQIDPSPSSILCVCLYAMSFNFPFNMRFGIVMKAVTVNKAFINNVI